MPDSVGVRPLKPRTGKGSGRPLLLALLIAAAPCAVAGPNKTNDQLLALPGSQRQALFALMLGSSGERCSSVTRTFFQGSSSNGAAFWSVSCAGGKDWQVMVNPDAGGSTKILECSMLRALNAGKCFTKYTK